MPNDSSRRDFLKTSTVAAAGAALTSTVARTAHAAGSDEIKFALVGCGGRGSGAADQIMNTKGNTKLVAVADAFGDKAEGSIQRLGKKHKEKVDVSPDNTFVGLDAYKKVT